MEKEVFDPTEFDQMECDIPDYRELFDALTEGRGERRQDHIRDWAITLGVIVAVLIFVIVAYG